MKKVILAVLVLIMLGSGGVLLAQRADAAEPGDSLYSIDLLAERVQRNIIFDELKKAEFEGEVLGERISEYQSLAERSDDVEEILEEVEKQQERVRENIGALENNPGNYSEEALQQVQNRYEQQLERHIEVMEQVQNKGGEKAIQVKQQLVDNLEECGRGTCGSTTPAGENNRNEDAGNGSAPEDAGQPEDKGNTGLTGNPNN